MNLEKRLGEAIKEEAEKLIFRYHAYHGAIHQEHDRNKRRVSAAPDKEIKKPEYWDNDKKFNPFYVKRKANSIARSITKK